MAHARTIQFFRTLTPNSAPSALAEGEPGVELASTPPKLWIGVPASVDPSQKINLLAGAGGGTAWATLALEPNWTAPSGGLYYRTLGGGTQLEIYLADIYRTADITYGGIAALATLPVGFRPSRALGALIPAVAPTGEAVIATVTIATTGGLLVTATVSDVRSIYGPILVPLNVPV